MANSKSDVGKLDIDIFGKLQSDSRSLQDKIDKLHIVKLETTPTHLSKLSDIIKNGVAKTT